MKIILKRPIFFLPGKHRISQLYHGSWCYPRTFVQTATETWFNWHIKKRSPNCLKSSIWRAHSEEQLQVVHCQTTRMQLKRWTEDVPKIQQNSLLLIFYSLHKLITFLNLQEISSYKGQEAYWRAVGLSRDFDKLWEEREEPEGGGI